MPFCLVFCVFEVEILMLELKMPTSEVAHRPRCCVVVLCPLFVSCGCLVLRVWVGMVRMCAVLGCDALCWHVLVMLAVICSLSCFDVLASPLCCVVCGSCTACT